LENLKLKKTLKILTVLLILATAFLIGRFSDNGQKQNAIFNLIAGTKKLHQVDEGLYFALKNQNINSCPLGIITVTSGRGYSGIITLATVYNIEGRIKNIKILEQTETPSFFKRVVQSGFLKEFDSLKYSDSTSLRNIDAITGATLTSEGIQQAVNKANKLVATRVFNDNTEMVCSAGIEFGWQDIFLLLLIVFSILLYYLKIKRQTRNLLRLFLQISSFIILGLIFSEMISITYINTLLLGFFPANQIFWYLILAVLILPILFLGINPYYYGICPMGILQSFLQRLMPWKVNINNKKLLQILRIIPVILTIGIIVFALITRNPGYFGHEIFATVFRFEGQLFHWILAGFSIIAALFIKRPWCRFLCPIGAVNRFLNLVRSLFRN